MVNSILSTKHSPVKPDNISDHKQETTALNYEQGTPGMIRLDGWVTQMKASFQPANNADGTKNALLEMQLAQLDWISPKDFFHYLTKQNVSNIHLLTHDELTDHADNFLIQKAKQAAFQNLTAWFVGAKDSKPLETGTKDSHPVPDTTHAPKSQGQQLPANIIPQNTSLPDPSSPGDLNKDHKPANPAVETQETIPNDRRANAPLAPNMNQEKRSEDQNLEKETLPSQLNPHKVNTYSPDLQEDKEEDNIF